MKPRIAIQLYTLREEMKEDVFTTLQKVADLGYEGVEFAGFFDVPAKVMHRTLKALKLEVVASHTSIEQLENNLEEVIAYNKVIGNKFIVCPWSDLEDYESMERVVEQLRRIVPRIEQEEMTLLYHNHAHELDKVKGKTLLEHLIEKLEGKVGLELDTFWVHSTGQNAVNYMKANKEAIKLIHLKDGIGDVPKALGEGDVPLTAIKQEAVRMHLEWIVVENDNPSPNGLEDCKRSLAYLKMLG